MIFPELIEAAKFLLQNQYTRWALIGGALFIIIVHEVWNLIKKFFKYLIKVIRRNKKIANNTFKKKSPQEAKSKAKKLIVTSKHSSDDSKNHLSFHKNPVDTNDQYLDLTK